MERQVKNYTQLQKDEKIKLWSGLNQGRVAFQSMVDFTRQSSADHRSLLAWKVEEVIDQMGAPYLYTSPKGEYPKPDSMGQAEDQVRKAKNIHSDLIGLNIPLVKRIATVHKKLLSRNMPLTFDDLEGHGSVGLVQAVDRYNHIGADIEFGLYAHRRITGEIIDAYRRLNPFSRDEIADRQQLHAAYDELHILLERPPTDLELLTKTGFSRETIEAVGLMDSMFIFSVDHNTNGSDESSSNWNESPVSLIESNYGMQDDLGRLVDLIVIRQGLDETELNDREYFAIRQYFFNDLVMKEIAEQMGISTSRVSQILASAKTKLARNISPELPVS